MGGGRKVGALRLFVYRMVKRVRRLISGASEVERICSDVHSAEMTERFWLEWRSSKRLSELFATHAHSVDLDAAETAAAICAAKRVSGTVRANVSTCLQQIAMRNKVVAHIHSVKDTKFDHELHADMLQALWHALQPDAAYIGDKSREWGRIGFQQADPASDFRAGGLLALQQLLFFSKERPSIARRMLVEPAEEAARYPWACVGINITSEVVKLVDSRLLDRMLFGLPMQRAVSTVHSVYADMFEILHGEWIEANPENILAFPPVMKHAMQSVRDDLERSGTLVPPGA